LEMGIGNIHCKVDNGWASFTAQQTLQRSSKPAPQLVAKALGLYDDAIVSHTHAPIIASLGLPFVLVELSDLSKLSACLPDIQFFREGAQGTIYDQECLRRSIIFQKIPQQGVPRRHLLLS